jgi:hypothetical protein
MSLNVWMSVLLFCFVVFFVFCLFSYVCLCAPIKWSLIGVEGCVREVRTIGGKVWRERNVVSFDERGGGGEWANGGGGEWW